MSEHNETLADVLAEMRKRTKSYYYGREGRNLMRQYADRIEAAAKRERGNSAAMRETLEQLSDEVCDYPQKGLIQLPLPIEDLLKQARAALAAPPRNCDMPLVVDGLADNDADKAWLIFKQHISRRILRCSGAFAVHKLASRPCEGAERRMQ